MELNVWYDIDIVPDMVRGLYKVKMKNNAEHTATYNRVLKIFQPCSCDAIFYFRKFKDENRKDNNYHSSTVFHDKPTAWKIIEVFDTKKCKRFIKEVSHE